MKTLEEAIDTIMVKCVTLEPTVEEVGRVEETHSRYGAIGEEVAESEKAAEAVEAMLMTFGMSCSEVLAGRGMCKKCSRKMVYATMINGVIVGIEMEKQV